jgi:hypothetical protein
MMPAIDYDRIVLGFLTLLAQLAILTVALWCGVWSLLRLRRPIGAAGLRLAFIALGLSLMVLAWAVLAFRPTLSPGPRPHLWVPFVPLGVAATSATLWGLRGRRISGTVRMMAVVAAIALMLGGGISLQRLDFRRANLHQARLEDRSASGFREAALRAERCGGHLRLGEPCDRCRDRSLASESYYAKEFRRYEIEAAQRARAWRRRAEE